MSVRNTFQPGQFANLEYHLVVRTIVYMCCLHFSIACTGCKDKKARVVVPRPCSFGNGKPQLLLSNIGIVVLDSSRSGQFTTPAGTIHYEYNTATLAYHSRPGSVADTVFNTLVTDTNCLVKLVLSDSTVAWLNAASSLYYPLDFPRRYRYVQLVGEAYFQVSRKTDDSGHTVPFVVGLRNVPGKTRVITLDGGACKILGFFGENRSEVIPLSGMAHVVFSESVPERWVNVKVGRHLLVSDNEVFELKENTEPDEWRTGWTHGTYNFSKVPLEEVLQRASRWYGKQFVFRDSRNVLVSAMVSICDSLPEFLKGLNLPSPRFTVSSDTIYVGR